MQLSKEFESRNMEQKIVLTQPSVSCQTEEKLYICTVCSQVFREIDLLRQHGLAHSAERHHHCKLCKKTFKTESALTRHTASHSEAKVYTCNQCKKTLKWKKSMNEHMRLHSQELCLPCEVCEKRFTARRHLTRHMEVHSIDRPYKCDSCEISFKRVSSLHEHKKSHNVGGSESSYSCEQCGMVYRFKRGLTVHQRLHAVEHQRVQAGAGSVVMFAPHSAHAVPDLYCSRSCGMSYTDETHLSRHLTTDTNNTSLPDEEDRCDNSNSAGSSTNLHRKLLNASAPSILGIPQPSHTYREDNSEGPDHKAVLKTNIGILGIYMAGSKPLTKANTTKQTTDTIGKTPLRSLLKEKKPVQHGGCTAVNMSGSNEVTQPDHTILEDSFYPESSEMGHLSQIPAESEAAVSGIISPLIPSDLLAEADELITGWSKETAAESSCKYA